MAGDGWTTKRVGEVANINPDAIGRDWPHSHIRYIDISSVGVGEIEVAPQWMKLSDAPSRAKRLVRKGDTVLSTVRPNRRSMFFASEPGDDWVVSTGFVVLRPNIKLIEPRFLYACVFSQAFTEYLITREKGAAYPAVSPEDIANAKIPLPPLAEQRAIACILGTLDDKIELNRRRNRTLEGLARAIFQSWFVDFDPVTAKAAGDQPPGLSPALAALFPDRFEDSPLGPIPAGWRVGCILEIADLLSGGTPKTSEPSYWDGEIPWASAKDVSQCGESFLIDTERTITQLGLENSATQIIPVFSSVVVARGATTGRMTMFGHDIAMNQTCYALKSKFGTPRHLYLLLRHKIDAIVHTAHGSVFDTITTATFRASKVGIAANELVREFDKRVSPMFDQILATLRQSRTLAALRDALLPKLISGELRVPDAERIVGRAT